MSTTTVEESTTMTVTDKLRADLEAAAAEFQAADAAREAAVEQAKRVANRAFKAGMPQAEIARIMGVDKSRTVRRWLGLMAD